MDRVGGVLIVIGQLLNVGVFVQLGKIGVFYGNRLGTKSLGGRACPFRFSAILNTSVPCCLFGGSS